MSNKEYWLLENCNTSTSSDIPQDQLNKNDLNTSRTISNYLKLLSESSYKYKLHENGLSSPTFLDNATNRQSRSTNFQVLNNNMNPKYCPICDDSSDEESIVKSYPGKKKVTIDSNSGDHEKPIKRTASERLEMSSDVKEITQMCSECYECSDDNSDGSLEVILAPDNSTDTVVRNKKKLRNNKNTGQKRRRMDNRRQ